LACEAAGPRPSRWCRWALHAASSEILGGDGLLQCLQRAELQPAHGASALAHDLADLFRRKPLDETEDDDLLLFGGECAKGGLEAGAAVGGEDPRVRVDDVVAGVRVGQGVLEGDARSGGTGAVDDGVSGDAVEPGEERLAR